MELIQSVNSNANAVSGRVQLATISEAAWARKHDMHVAASNARHEKARNSSAIRLSCSPPWDCQPQRSLALLTLLRFGAELGS